MKYIGELSLFGKVGNATMSYTNDGKNYHIKIKGGGSGIVAKLTKHKRYVYESIGRVENGILIPDQYIGRELSNDYNKTKTYLFDYKNSKTVVTQQSIKRKEISDFNIMSMKYDISHKIVKKKKVKTLKKIYQDDMVSMFFNKRLTLLAMKKSETRVVYAVGSKDTENGMVVKLIKTDGAKYTYSIRIKKDYLSGGSEDATFILDANNILYETKLAGIMFFGDARVRRLR
ncbi:MAG: DUF3108 domain-containing protein [Epsilonproteobacteria bacterium]|nr:MAG: DUF3108 domain-containing protein [Campylobacterota bacterium]